MKTRGGGGGKGNTPGGKDGRRAPPHPPPGVYLPAPPPPPCLHGLYQQTSPSSYAIQWLAPSKLYQSFTSQSVHCVMRSFNTTMGHVPAHWQPSTKTQLRSYFFNLYEMYEKLSLQLSSKRRKLGTDARFYLHVFNKQIRLTFIPPPCPSDAINLGHKSLSSKHRNCPRHPENHKEPEGY